MVKQAACAAAINSSGLVPGWPSKRVPKPYGCLSSTPDLVVIDLSWGEAAVRTINWVMENHPTPVVALDAAAPNPATRARAARALGVGAIGVQAAPDADTGDVVSEATAQAVVQTPIALLGGLFSLPGGPASVLSIARVLGSNFPLVLLLVMIGALFWPSEDVQPSEQEADTIRKPNGADAHLPSGLRP